MPVEEVIREHRKFGKRLDSIGFTVSSKGRQIIVKFGKKLNIIECPTIEAAQSLADGFNTTIQSRAKQIDEFITLMEANCQQLNLFAPTKQSRLIPIGEKKSIYEEMNEIDKVLEQPERVSLDEVLTGEAPVPTENPFEGIEEQEVPDHHQS